MEKGSVRTGGLPLGEWKGGGVPTECMNMVKDS